MKSISPKPNYPHLPVSKLLELAERKVRLGDRYFGEGKLGEAKCLYVEAVDLVYSNMGGGKGGMSGKSGKSGMSVELRKRCSVWLKKAEDIEAKLLQPQLINTPTSRSSRSELPSTDRLTPHEINILRETSQINNKLFIPWCPNDATKSFDKSFDDTSLFLDPDGLLELSQAQRKDFGGWKRPSDLFGDKLVMINQLSSTRVVQNVITNCSFVASLCICASYELRFGKRLLTSAIYPQDKDGQPILSRNGKYVVKLHSNGINRKVVIDDLLPVSSTGEFMCTHSKIKGEIWPSLFEKAYMKLSGGYSFLGSNSSVDLHSLTGWIPEQVFFARSDNLDGLWNRLLEGYDKGFVIATIGTGPLSEHSELSLGLIRSHAYAILAVKNIQTFRLLKVRNPWGHYRWKGAFSHLDLSRWTPELQRQAGYDPIAAQEKDDGIFWIDYESVCETFETLNLNWNPEYFPFTYSLHNNWVLHEERQQDEICFSLNPQFILEVNSPSNKPTVVWVLLTKHVVSNSENVDYLAVHVYHRECYDKRTRIFSHDGPIIKGVYMNSTHILTKFNAPPDTNHYTLVLSQKGIQVPFNYTVKVFSMAPFRFTELPAYKYSKKISSAWDWESSGGNITCPGFFDNPQFNLTVPSTKTMSKSSYIVTLSCPGDYPVGMVVFKGGHLINNVSKSRMVKKSDVYKLHFNVFQTVLDPGSYTIVPSTYQSGMSAEFNLAIFSDSQIEVQPISKLGEGMFRSLFEGVWEKKYSTVGEELVTSKFLLKLTKNTRLKIRLIPSGDCSGKTPIGIQIVTKEGNQLLASSGDLSISFQGVYLEHLFEVKHCARVSKAAASAKPPQEFHIHLTAKILSTTNFSMVIYHDAEMDCTTYP